MIRAFLPLVAIVCAAPALAQTPPSTPAVTAPATSGVRVGLETTEGTIVLELDAARAPVTTANFLKYIDQKRLDGTGFYRAMKFSSGGLVQGGTQQDPKRTLPPIAHEPTSQTGIAHLDGTVSMARYDPGTANGDFFITVGPVPSLDASTADPGFAAFGRVVEGMDVVKKILAAPVSAIKGEGIMRGQMIENPVRIVSARRAK